ncbi:MAG: sensor histidine kinase [Halobacteriovoraceae bacterium]|nr:sensor histidine kinase [Halobacteriovoraceae bacterium]
MFFKFLFFLTFIFITNSYAESIDWNLCVQNHCSPYKLGTDINYKRHPSISRARLVSNKFDKPSCAQENDCSLFLGEIADGYKIKLNGKTLVDNSTKYLKHESSNFNLPSFLFKITNNIIEIELFNLNNAHLGLLSSQTSIDHSLSVEITSHLDWFFRTGVQLTSIYTLTVIVLFLSFVYLINKDLNIISVLFYSLISIFYLISFSEIPRTFLNPELLSGAIHLPLRLAQDLFLVMTFNQFLNPYGHFTNLYKSMKYTYIVFILIMLVSAVSGTIDYSFYKNIIFVAAPLVALPFSFGLMLALRQRRGRRRFILSVTMLIFLIMQINDLMVFWQVYPGYFTVKFYIPFLAIFLLYIYLWRLAKLQEAKNNLATKASIAMQVTHDIKSPVAALRSLKQYIELPNSEAKDIFENSLERIQNISDSFVNQCSKSQRVSINALVLSILREKKALLKEKKISHSFQSLLTKKEDMLYTQPRELQRIVANILNNAIEAIEGDGSIDITLSKGQKHVLIAIQDTGKGISEDVLYNLGNLENTCGKKNGQGLGLYHAFHVLRKMGSDLKIFKNTKGTTVQIIL